jgi:PAS domain-containing protein
MSHSQRILLMAAFAVYSVLVLVLDIVTPLGIEAWVLNLPVVIVPVLFRSPRMVVLFGVASSAMLVVAWRLSPPGGFNPPSWDLLNRGMGLATIWLIAVVVIKLIKRTIQLDVALSRLRRETAQRERVGRALEQSEERLRLAMEGAGMGTLDVNLQTGRILWSATHLRMLGYKATSAREASIDLWTS